MDHTLTVQFDLLPNHFSANITFFLIDWYNLFLLFYDLCCRFLIDILSIHDTFRFWRWLECTNPYHMLLIAIGLVNLIGHKNSWLSSWFRLRFTLQLLLSLRLWTLLSCSWWLLIELTHWNRIACTLFFWRIWFLKLLNEPYNCFWRILSNLRLLRWWLMNLRLRL